MRNILICLLLAGCATAEVAESPPPSVHVQRVCFHNSFHIFLTIDGARIVVDTEIMCREA